MDHKMHPPPPKFKNKNLEEIVAKNMTDFKLKY